ncbi:MAG: TadE/TadG family type IV pilus assembly protein [Candidatus Limnocylindrales bacterium]|nr:TadE/TadG family type IV pilus assembly protein [Candidatus Limnocylindrales bacterium]
MARTKGSGGQTLVEFALVLPLFLLLVFGLIDMGRLVYMNSTISQAAREATRVAAVEASWIGSTRSDCNQTGGPVCPANVAAFRADVLAAANRMMAPFGSIADADLYTSCTTTPPTPVTTTTCNYLTDVAADQFASVRTELVFRPLTPVISSFISSITTSGSATMVIN